MEQKKHSGMVVAFLCALTLAACGQQAEPQAEKLAAEAKAKVEAEARAAEAKAKEAKEAAEALAKEAEARAIAIESYVYAYPLVTMEMTRRVMTNVAAPEENRAPMGQFLRKRTYPDASYRDVTAPNADTLYTTAWIDVSKEPWIFSIPDMKGRYALFPMLDG